MWRGTRIGRRDVVLVEIPCPFTTVGCAKESNYGMQHITGRCRGIVLCIFMYMNTRRQDCMIRSEKSLLPHLFSETWGP